MTVGHEMEIAQLVEFSRMIALEKRQQVPIMPLTFQLKNTLGERLRVKQKVNKNAKRGKKTFRWILSI